MHTAMHTQHTHLHPPLSHTHAQHTLMHTHHCHKTPRRTNTDTVSEFRALVQELTGQDAKYSEIGCVGGNQMVSDEIKINGGGSLMRSKSMVVIIIMMIMIMHWKKSQD
ncbi:hypothetical protein LOK49_LG03G03137 [Camellia lanceoleosa]|uniref:Uncharacterized protein n=1 Tax=Camellia lanceoleosa TaxID=1840588 RepID=A0ACC0I742_9ERIC|nr:hypothetical protein LOK49_LG03G03137 [Camellia lanceoleosa]